MNPKTKKILLLAGAGAIGLFILTRSSGQEENAPGSQLVRAPLTFPTFPAGDVETGTPNAPSAPSITYNLPSFPDPAPIPSYDFGLISPEEFFAPEPLPSAFPSTTKKAKEAGTRPLGIMMSEAAATRAQQTSKKEAKAAEYFMATPNPLAHFQEYMAIKSGGEN